MADHSDYDFIGNYDHEKKAGLLHVADHHVSPGKKQWTWENGDFGQAWDRNLTDEDGPYIELMTGMFTDNQPDFTFLKPYEEKTFTQYFLPYKGIGAVKNANTRVAINLEQTPDGVKILVYGMEKDETVTITLTEGKEVLFQEKTVISPVKFYEKEVALKEYCMEKMELTVTTSDGDSLSYQKEEEQEISIPKPAEALPKPECVQKNEKLFLAAVHLEQYRHATYSPADYYLEALKKAFLLDETDARVYFELDQLRKLMNVSVEERLEDMQKHIELVEKRDDLYTEYVTLLNTAGRYEQAYQQIMSHHFHPWEGGEGKITSQYRFSLRMLSQKAKQDGKRERSTTDV